MRRSEGWLSVRAVRNRAAWTSGFEAWGAGDGDDGADEFGIGVPQAFDEGVVPAAGRCLTLASAMAA
jgi:hypothetical protein